MAAMHEASLLRGRSGGAGMRNSTLKIALDARRATRGGPAAIAARQQARLAELVAFARTCSPYYRRLYKDLPADANDPRFLPPVTKPQLVENFDEWVTDPAVTKQACGILRVGCVIGGNALSGPIPGRDHVGHYWHPCRIPA